MAIIFTNLSKNYGKKPVLQEINLTIPAVPAIIGLIGPNGVGKSTMLRLLAGVLEPTCGTIHNDQTDAGYGSWASLHTDFVASGERGLRNKLNTLENGMYFSSLKGISIRQTERNIRTLAADMEFSDKLDVLFQELSTGLKKKAAVLVGAALGTGLLLLDEPSNGLDIAAQEDLTSFILALKNQHGKTIVVSSHDTQMLSGVVDHYLFLKKGQIERQIAHRLDENELIAIYRQVYGQDKGD